MTTQTDIWTNENLNRPITNRISTQISYKENLRLRCPHQWILPNIYSRININSSQTLQKIEERIVPNWFYETITALIPKPDKDITRKENHRPGNSLVVQWLGPQAFTAEAQVQSLDGEERSHKLHSVAKKEKKKNHRLTSPITCWIETYILKLLDRKSKNPLQNMRKPNSAKLYNIYTMK